jgi:hypothetical protein
VSVTPTEAVVGSGIWPTWTYTLDKPVDTSTLLITLGNQYLGHVGGPTGAISGVQVLVYRLGEQSKTVTLLDSAKAIMAANGPASIYLINTFMLDSSGERHLTQKNNPPFTNFDDVPISPYFTLTTATSAPSPGVVPTVSVVITSLGVITTPSSTGPQALLTDSSGNPVGGNNVILEQGAGVYPGSYIYIELQTTNATCYDTGDGNTKPLGPSGAGIGWFYISDLVGGRLGPLNYEVTVYNNTNGNLDKALSATGYFKLNVDAPYYSNYGNPSITISNSAILINHNITATITGGNPGQTYTVSGAPFGSSGSGALDGSGNGTSTFNITTPGSYAINFDFDQPDRTTTRKSFPILVASSTPCITSYTATVSPSGTIDIDVESSVTVTVTFDKPVQDPFMVFDIDATVTYDTPVYDPTTDQNITTQGLAPPGGKNGTYYYQGFQIKVFNGQTSASNTFDLGGLKGSGTVTFTCNLEGTGVDDLGAGFTANGGFPISGSAPGALKITSSSNFTANNQTSNSNPELEQAIANGTLYPSGLSLGPISSTGQYKIYAVYYDNNGKSLSKLIGYQVTAGIPTSGIFANLDWTYDGTSLSTIVDGTYQPPNRAGAGKGSSLVDPSSNAANSSVDTTFLKGSASGLAGNIVDIGSVLNVGVAGNWSSTYQNKPIQYSITGPDGTVYPGTGVTNSAGGFSLPNQTATAPGLYTYNFTLPDGSVISQDYIVKNTDGTLPPGVETNSNGVVVPIPGYIQNLQAQQAQTPANQTGSVVGGATGPTTVSTPSVHDIPVARDYVPSTQPTPPADTNIIDAPSQVTAGQLFNASLNAGANYANQTVTVTVTNPDGTETTSQETLDANGSIQYTGASIGQPGQYKYTWTAANGASVSTNLNVAAPPTTSTPDNSAVDNSGQSDNTGSG